MTGDGWTRSRDEDGRPVYTRADGSRIVRDGIPSWPFTLYRPDGDAFTADRLWIAKAEAG